MRIFVTSVILLFLTATPAWCQQSGSQPKKLTWDEQLDQIMPPMTEAIELDGLQEAAIRQILLNQFRQSNMLSKEVDFDNDRKREESMAVFEKTDEEIKKLLRPNQIELYDQYKKDLRKGKKPKKKKKS
ncbi:hypothetical protein [Flavobacterium silvaticum]|uniref:DUF4890 domain-containing protein n=1 Tax=Flavobacterium silvaticum TaxID=1852020 RepID=A0A972FPD9_9FLAO|nr:hypothetical protein [Flavobacterium silvaticum]NMH26974.1 hypothetical protein [Flavobacterium silvaticum]